MTCRKCKAEIRIGDYPFCPHGRPVTEEYRPFKPFYDEGLGAQINSLAEWNREMKRKNADLRDPYSPGQMSAYKDKQRERRKAEGRT